jgi:hypothetical protein
MSAAGVIALMTDAHGTAGTCLLARRLGGGHFGAVRLSGFRAFQAIDYKFYVCMTVFESGLVVLKKFLKLFFLLLLTVVMIIPQVPDRYVYAADSSFFNWLTGVAEQFNSEKLISGFKDFYEDLSYNLEEAFDMAKEGYKTAYDVVVDSLAIEGRAIRDVVMDVWNLLDGVKKSNLIDFYVQNRNTNFYITPELSAELSIDLFTTEIYNTFVQQIAVEAAKVDSDDDDDIFPESGALTFDEFIDEVYHLFYMDYEWDFTYDSLTSEYGDMEVAYFRDSFRYLPAVVPVSVIVSDGTEIMLPTNAVDPDYAIEFNRNIVSFVIGHDISFDDDMEVVSNPYTGRRKPYFAGSVDLLGHLTMMPFSEDNYWTDVYYEDGFTGKSVTNPLPRYISFIYTDFLSHVLDVLDPHRSYFEEYRGKYYKSELDAVFTTLDFEPELCDIGEEFFGEPGVEYYYKYYYDVIGTGEHQYFDYSDSHEGFNTGIPCNISSYIFANDIKDFEIADDAVCVYDLYGEYYVLNPFKTKFELKDFDIMQDYPGEVNYYQYFYNTENYSMDEAWLDELKSIIDGAVKETVTYNSTLVNNYYSEYNTVNNEVVVDFTPIEHKLDNVLSNQATSLNFMDSFRSFAEDRFDSVLSAIALLTDDITDMFNGLNGDLSPRLDILHDDLVVTNGLMADSIRNDATGVKDGLLRYDVIVYIVFCILGLLMLYITIRFVIWLLKLIWSFIANFLY